MNQHPLSAAFPSMSDDDYQALKWDIEKHGQREPIIVLDDMVLDGWHRYRACEELGMPIKRFKFDESDDPVAFVKSENFYRRHLTASERAAVELTLFSWKKQGRQNKGAPGAPLDAKPEKSLAELAVSAKVSERTMKHAITADKAGLLDMVKEGAVTAKEADAIVRGKPKKAKKQKPAQAVDVTGEDAGFGDGDVLEKWSAEVKENTRLNELIADLQANDKDKKIKEQADIIYGLTGRINGFLAAQKAMEKQQKYHADFVHKLRKIFGVETHQEILDAAQAMVA